jgi:hypothetical protein
LVPLFSLQLTQPCSRIVSHLSFNS